MLLSIRKPSANHQHWFGTESLIYLWWKILNRSDSIFRESCVLQYSVFSNQCEMCALCKKSMDTVLHMYFRVIILARDALSCCWRFCVKGLMHCFLSSARLWLRQARNMWPGSLAIKVSCHVASLVNKRWLVHLTVLFTRSQAVARIANHTASKQTI